MDTFEAILARKSVRAYEPKPVPKEVLEKILEAGLMAPSAGNIKPWRFIVVTDADKRNVISRGPFAKFVTQAPVVIVACGDSKASAKWHVVDVSIAVENMVLAATSLGLGTCWIGGFIENEVRKLLEIPEQFKIVVLLSVGYPRKKVDLGRALIKLVRRRKKLDEIVSVEKFGEKYTPISSAS